MTEEFINKDPTSCAHQFAYEDTEDGVCCLCGVKESEAPKKEEAVGDIVAWLIHRMSVLESKNKELKRAVRKLELEKAKLPYIYDEKYRQKYRKAFTKSLGEMTKIIDGYSWGGGREDG